MSNKIYIFGAGSSVHAGGPLNKNWIEQIKNDPDNINDYATAISFLNSLPGFDNLEALLSLIDLSIIEQHNYLPVSASLSYLESIRKQIICCIVNVAKKLNKKAKIDSVIKNFFNKTKLQEGDTVINFNYDLLVDNALFKTGLWNPYKGIKNNTCGYGFGISSLACLKETEALGAITTSQIDYLKLHGSINWLNNTVTDIDWNLFDPAGISKTSFIYPSSPTNFIVTPSFIKIFEGMSLRMLWLYAHENISKATEIYIIGYSFPKADALARQLLLHVNESVNKMIVVDPLSDGFNETDKLNDLISMLPWKKDNYFWDKIIEINRQTFNEYVRAL